MWRSHAYELFSTSSDVSSVRQRLEGDSFAQCFGTPGKQLERADVLRETLDDVAGTKRFGADHLCRASDRVVETGIGRDVVRDEALRESPEFFAKVTEVREALHGAPVRSHAMEGR